MWTGVIQNASFETQGELASWKALQCGINLNKVRTAGFTVRLDNNIGPYIAQNVSTEPIYLKLSRNGVLMFYGPVATAQEVGDSNDNATLQVNCVGPEFMWAFKIIHNTAIAKKYAAGVNHGTRMKEFLTPLAGSYNEDHVNITKGPISCSNTEEIEVQTFKTIAEVLQELSQQAAGFDWMVYPWAEGGTEVAYLSIKDVIGEPKLGALFEWGTGRQNIASFNRTADTSQMANLVYNFTGAGPEATGAPTVNSEWPGTTPLKLAELWGLRQAVANINVLNTAMRQQYVNEVAAVRRLPRQTIAFQPVVDNGYNVPVLGVDYEVGDSVQARLVYEGSIHFDALVRVWGIAYAVDENGKETQTLTTSDA